jgi:predicted metal-dependent enzyme (double-stranded beta helix superfamily)
MFINSKQTRPAGAVSESRQTEAGGVNTIEAFVATIDAMMDTTTDTTTIVAGVQSYLAPLLNHPDLLTEEQRLPSPDRYRSHIVAIAPSRRFSVVSLVWLPGQVTPIHDHICWCVVGVLEGEEFEERYSLKEDEQGNRWLARTGEWLVSPGGVTSALVPPEENIHRVRNAGEQLAISIHVYGADIGFYGSSINECFDALPEYSPAKPGRPVAWRFTRSQT